MTWSRVVGQDHAKELLITAIKKGQLSHAYCIWGPPGVGKDALALELARVLNCLNPIETPSSIEACDQCQSCLQMSHLQHPNLHFVFALPSSAKSSSDDESPLLRLSDDQISLIQEQLALKARNVYHDISIPNASQIRIAAIREVRRLLQLVAPTDHGWRFVIVSEADTMTHEAANAFLKTLEEPHVRTTLVLTTSRRELLPATIRSRCQHIHCGSLSTETIASALVEREGVALERARIIAALAHGSYSKALELAALDQDDGVLATQAIDFLRAILKRERFRTGLVKTIEQIASTFDRQNIAMLLRTLLLWLHDAYRLITIGAHATELLVFRHGTAYTSLQQFSAHYTRADLPRAIAAVERTIAAIESNAQVSLALIVLALRLRDAILRTHHIRA